MVAGWPTYKPTSKPFLSACAAAVAIEFAALTVVGYSGHWLAHPKSGMDESRFVEAQVFEVPQEAHLTEEKPLKKAAVLEPEISKTPLAGRAKKPGETAAKYDENETSSGAQSAPDHGPVAIYAPRPALQDYLRNQDLNPSLVLGFYVMHKGLRHPALWVPAAMKSSDALATATPKK